MGCVGGVEGLLCLVPSAKGQTKGAGAGPLTHKSQERIESNSSN